MEPTSPFYSLSSPGYGLPTAASAFTWDLTNGGMPGRELVPLAARMSNNHNSSAYSLPILSACSPLPVPTNPLLWRKEDVECWIRWCITEFSLSNLDPKSFSMNGKALCLLPKESFTHRTAQSGDVLYEILQKLIYYNGYLNRQGDTQEPRYQPATLLHPANRLSPNHPSAPPPPPSASSLLPPSSFHSHIQRCNNSTSNNLDNENMVTSSSYEHRDDHRVGRNLSAAPLKLRNTDNHSSTPCSDSGNSSPGMAEEDPHQQQPIGHPLSRNAMASHCPSHQLRLGPLSQQHPSGQQCHRTHKRQRSSSEMEDPAECMSPIKKTPPTTSTTSMDNLGLEANIHAHAQYLMQQQHQGRIGLHESSARVPTSPESAAVQRLASERAAAATDSQHHIHPHPHQIDPLHHSHHHDNRSRMFPVGYPIPMPLSYLDSCTGGRNRTMFFGAEENGGMYRHHHEEDVDPLDDDIFSNGEKPSDCRLLWEFLSQLLKQEKYSPYIKWEDEEARVFRIQDPTAIASLWGRQKNRTNMTYEKLSRALRYYYKTGILQKEPGQKLTYRFLQDPKDIASSQRFSKANRSKTATDVSPSSTSATADDSSSHSMDEDSLLVKDQSAGDDSATNTAVMLDDTDEDSVESVSSDDDTVEEVVAITSLNVTRSVQDKDNVEEREMGDLHSAKDTSSKDGRFVVGSPVVVDQCVLIKEELVV